MLSFGANRLAYLHAVLIIVAVLFTIVSVSPALISLHDRWIKFDEPYSHGYIIIALCLYFALVRVPHLATINNKRPSWIGVGWLIASWLVYLLGYLSFSELLQQLALPLILTGLIFSSFGWRVVLLFAMPICLTYFSIPIWDALVDPFRTFTTSFVSWCLGLLNIPAFISGFVIELPSGSIEIAGGCSGLNYFMVSLLIGLCYAEIILGSRFRLASIIIAVSFGIFANWVRVLMLVLIAYNSEMQHPLVNSHVNFGWYVFAGSLIVYFVIMAIIFRRDVNLPQTGYSVTNSGEDIGVVKNTGPSFYPIMLALFISACVALIFKSFTDENHTKKNRLVLPATINAELVSNPVWLPAYSGYDSVQQWKIVDINEEILFTILVYDYQKQGKELVYFSNQLASQRFIEDMSSLELANGNIIGRSALSINENRYLAYWAFQIGEHITNSAVRAKLLQIPSRFVPQSSVALIVATSACLVECEYSAAITESMLVQLFGELSWTSNSSNDRTSGLLQEQPKY